MLLLKLRQRRNHLLSAHADGHRDSSTTNDGEPEPPFTSTDDRERAQKGCETSDLSDVADDTTKFMVYLF